MDQRLDYVVIVLAEGAEAPFEDIRKDVANVFGKMGERWAGELESF